MFLRRFFFPFADPISQSNELLDSLQQRPPVISNGNFFNSTESALDSLSWLHTVSPCFPVRGDKVHIINEPAHFYKTLVDRIATARDRIVLASLYLGTGHLENNFVQALRKSLKQKPSIKVNVLLDFTRGTRGEINSKTMLMPLVKEFGGQMQLSLYHTPNLRGITKRLIPSRWNELVGLQHMKIYLFDDAVLISGANLSNDYFTNRQDRYILIEDKALADFYAGFISRVQDFSLLVNQNAQTGLRGHWTVLPYEGNKQDFINKAKEHIITFMQDKFQEQQKAIAVIDDKAVIDTWIFPLIEMGQLNIHHESLITQKLLSNCLNGSRLKLATGYFNLTQDYMDTLTHKCLAQCSILMAHPNANGFQGAKGLAGGIPAAYTLIAKSFYENLVNRRQEHRINFFEYEKRGWTYHAKGLWYYLPTSALPILTLIGSSNFGERSVNRDLESQVCLVTTNPSLSQRLQHEHERLFNLSSTAERQIITRHIPHWIKAVVKIFRNFF